jgi:hypothetical protein
VDEVPVLLGCDAAALNIWFLIFRGGVVVSSFSGLSFPTFRNNAVVSSSVGLGSILSSLRMRQLRSFEKSGTEYPVTQRHNPENEGLDAS